MKIFVSIIFGLFCISAFAEVLYWPTPHTGFAKGEDFSTFIQPTVSGDPVSGLFGCVRNDGNRFHEAIDIAPFLKRKGGEATDPIYAAYGGTVVHVSRLSGKSSYGRYIVIEHNDLDLPVYTLYSHLASISSGIKSGVVVSGGQVLGKMGRSAGGYRIPRERAHLHFEIGLRLSDDFQSWYDEQKFGSPNDHGNYNGMNLVSWDPLSFYKTNRENGSVQPLEYIGKIHPGFVIKLKTSEIPNLLKRYPALLIPNGSSQDRAGWEIRISGWGLPLSFKPLSSGELKTISREGEARVTAINWSEVNKYACRDMVEKVGDSVILSSGGIRLLDLLFR